MFKKAFLFIVILSSYQITHAKELFSCPSADDVKQLHFNLDTWQAFTIDNGTPIEKNELPTYTSRITQQKLTEYMIDAPEGPSHCYYGEENSD